MSPARSATAAGEQIEILGVISIIPVVIIDDAAQSTPLAEALIADGIGTAEITLRIPQAMAALEIMARYPGFLAGAGTLVNPGPGRGGRGRQGTVCGVTRLRSAGR